MIPNIIELEQERFLWPVKTFTEATAISSLRKLESEIKEIEYNIEVGIRDPFEYADALMCLLDSAGRNGISVEEILIAFKEKIKINQSREWIKNPDNSYSHIKNPLLPARLDSLEIGETYKYNPKDVGIFKVLAKDETNWIKTIRTQSGRITGGFPWTEVYPVKNL